MGSWVEGGVGRVRDLGGGGLLRETSVHIFFIFVHIGSYLFIVVHILFIFVHICSYLFTLGYVQFLFRFVCSYCS